MIDWNAGRYFPADSTWQFVEGTIEILVAGTSDAPSPYWTDVANEVVKSIERHCTSGMRYLDAFVDRQRIAAGWTWEIESAEFGGADEADNARFVLTFRLTGDQYGLWSVAFHATGLPEPNDVFPSRFQRQQQ